MVLIALILFGISLWLALAEVYYERDWPRDSFRFVLIFGAILLVALAGR